MDQDTKMREETSWRWRTWNADNKCSSASDSDLPEGGQAPLELEGVHFCLDRGRPGDCGDGKYAKTWGGQAAINELRTKLELKGNERRSYLSRSRRGMNAHIERIFDHEVLYGRIVRYGHDFLNRSVPRRADSIPGMWR